MGLKEKIEAEIDSLTEGREAFKIDSPERQMYSFCITKLRKVLE